MVTWAHQISLSRWTARRASGRPSIFSMHLRRSGRSNGSPRTLSWVCSESGALKQTAPADLRRVFIAGSKYGDPGTRTHSPRPSTGRRDQRGQMGMDVRAVALSRTALLSRVARREGTLQASRLWRGMGHHTATLHNAHFHVFLRPDGQHPERWYSVFPFLLHDPGCLDVFCGNPGAGRE